MTNSQITCARLVLVSCILMSVVFLNCFVRLQIAHVKSTICFVVDLLALLMKISIKA